MGDELRWAFRYARRRPILALTITATLACAIATATTAFGLARAILWRELPFRDASRLVFVWEDVERDGQHYPSRVTGARYAAWREAAGDVASTSIFAAAGFTIESPGGAMSVRGVRVSANFFETLGIRPVLGRTFAPDEEQPGRHHVAILSSAMWQERFGARRDVVGDTIRLSGEPYTIVGVMPHETFPAWPVNPAAVTLDPGSRQLWVPIQRTPELDHNARSHVFGVVARLASGVGERAFAERLAGAPGADAEDPHGTRLKPIREQFVEGARPQLLALAGTALAVLLIACTNLAALYLSAFESRRGELAVRVAIGASMMLLIRQLLLEAWVLAAVGGACGIAIARIALTTIPGVLPPTVPFLTAPTVDRALALFAIALTALASVILSAWPAARLIGVEPLPRGSVASPRNATYRGLVVCQVAMTVVLVTTAALLAQSLRTIHIRETGFAVENVLVADIGLPPGTASHPSSVALSERGLLAAVAARPGVRAVAAAYDHPLEANWSENLVILGDSTAEEQRQQVELRIVSPEYFEVLVVELLDGRVFTARDTLERPGAAIVNEALALAIGGRVLGRRLRSGPPRFTYGSAAPDEFEIVGVVRNERFRGLEQPLQPAYYLNTRQFPQTGFSLLVRTAGDPLALAADVRWAVRAANSAATFDRATSLERILADQMAERRLTTEVIGGFATAALALAALGMYGLLAVLVASRRRDIGVRLAIGASPGVVARDVVAEALRSAGAGIVIGALFALGAGPVLRSLLVGVSGRDPVTILAVCALLLAVAILAAAIPAVRAARTDPLEALRAD